MKLTTKIVLGIIISIFLLSAGVIIGISFIDIEKYRQSYTGVSLPRISQENIITVEVEPYQTIMVEKELMNDKRDFNPFGTILIKPVINEGEKNKLLLPEELLRFTDITSSNDTLIIRLKMDELYEQHYPNKETKSGILYALDGANFFIHSNTVDVICNLYGIKLDIRNMETDRIKINTYGEVTIDSCQVNLIEPSMHRRKFLLTNSQVKELNIDLDRIGYGWQIENCDIEVENLTGSGKYRTDLAMSEAKTMNWLPKSKDAQLTVTLHGDTAKVMFP